MYSKSEKVTRLNSEKGFSLIELTISFALFLIVSAAVFGLLQVARESKTVVSENSALNKNVRMALNIVGRDTYNAGFGYPLRNTVILPDNRLSTLLGIPNDSNTTRDTVAPIIAGNNLTVNTYNTAANIRTDQITMLFKDTTFNQVGGVSQPLSINAATTTSGGIDEIIPLSGSNTLCRVNDLYLISGNTGSTIGVSTALSGSNIVQFSNGDGLGFNQTGTSGPLRSITVPASIQRIRMITYFVTADGTFTRREYANVLPATGFVDEPLIYGVEDFQIQYVMDDGSLSDNPSAGPNGIPGDADDTPTNLAAVRQVRFTVSVRSTELNAADQPYRFSQTTTFSTRNLGYDVN
ncbi:MAG TPA: prepilin-type N-terminal cleavage/methylation domain-containing protein [Pyrinomonadaceae bacterium]|nr:prepilin-type N-terminal cleavage/methylation domain-containing protein [Pyrinomonadaceae bacterium]